MGIDEIMGTIGSFFNGLVFGVFDWLSSWLPASPFVLVGWEGDGLGLGWLNYFVPVQRMLDFLAVWLVSMAAYSAVRLFLELARKLGTADLGGLFDLLRTIVTGNPVAGFLPSGA